MYNPVEISRIDRQIDELQRLKANYQGLQQPQQPINNIITSQPIQPVQQSTTPIFEAKFTTENPADVLIQHKTAFIDVKNGKLSIKELDGEIKEYGLILPKDEKDLRIEELESKMKKLESSYNALLMQSGVVNNQTITPSSQSITNVTTVPPKNIIIPETVLNDVTEDVSINTINNVGETSVQNEVSTSKSFKKGMFKQK